MKAPDKIYVAKTTFPEYVDWDGSPINTKSVSDNDVCYIRKDALLEWLNGKVYEHNEVVIDMNEELREFVRNRMKESMNELTPLIDKFMVILADAYEKGFWTGFHIGLTVEPKEDEK